MLLNLLVIVLCIHGLFFGTTSLEPVSWLVPKILGVGLLVLFSALVRRYYAAEARIEAIIYSYSKLTVRQRRMVRMRMGIYRAMSVLLLVVTMGWLTKS